MADQTSITIATGTARDPGSTQASTGSVRSVIGKINRRLIVGANIEIKAIARDVDRQRQIAAEICDSGGKLLESGNRFVSRLKS